MSNNDNPVFEVHQKDGKIFKIYADGRAEGFGEDPMVINRLPVRSVDKSARTTPKVG